MHAFAIIGKNNIDIEEKVSSIIESLHAQKVDFSLKKIDDVRQLGKITSLKQKDKLAYVVDKFQDASFDAQNAFLKILEEPHANTYFILTAETEESLLPTILSRVQVSYLSQSHDKLNDPVLAHNFVELSTGQKFRKTATIKDREEAISFLTNIVNESKDPMVLESGARALNALERNGNVTLQLTKFIVDLV